MGPPRPTDLLFIAWDSEGPDAGIAGCVRFCEEGDIHVLRSLLVATEHRGQGLGRLLVEAVSEHADAVGAGPLYCLAYPHLTSFYQEAGFEVVPEERVPHRLETRMVSYRLQGMDTVCLRRTAPSASGRSLSPSG